MLGAPLFWVSCVVGGTPVGGPHRIITVLFIVPHHSGAQAWNHYYWTCWGRVSHRGAHTCTNSLAAYSLVLCYSLVYSLRKSGAHGETTSLPPFRPGRAPTCHHHEKIHTFL